MARIHLLDDGVINKIAAGEVVERPASVVKELVDNALDAGCSRVWVELTGGGAEKILVRDDGQGLTRDEMTLAVTRHATSKITSEEDLFSVQTMGFRGEALASIASVSDFRIQSKPEGSPGSQLIMEAGRPKLESWDGPRGTSVIVENLFSQIPVRKAFLKTGITEYGHCYDVVRAYALSRPDVGFHLSHNGKAIFDTEAQPSQTAQPRGEAALRSRASAILGEELASHLLYQFKRDEYADLECLCSPPGYEKGSSKFLFTFVNGRWVKDPTIKYGVLSGYHGHLMSGKFPVAVVFVDVNPSLVDVNVHPAKTELRFQYGKQVQSAVGLGIRQAIRQGAWAKAPSDSPAPAETSHHRPPDGIRISSSLFTGLSEVSPDGGMGRRPAPIPASSQRSPRSASPFAPQQGVRPFSEDPAPRELPVEESQSIPWGELDFIGTFGKCYLLFQLHDERLLCVDQHAFHERILYERLLTRLSETITSETLLIAQVISMEASQVGLLLERASMMKKVGIVYKRVSDTELELTAMPSILKNVEPEAFLSELTDKDLEGTDAYHLTLATMACHSAVRSGEILSEEDLGTLIAEAGQVDFYHNCPHGRRVFKWFTAAQVGRWFDR